MICILKLDYERKIDGFMIGTSFGELAIRAAAVGANELAQHLYVSDQPYGPEPGNYGIVLEDGEGFSYQVLVE